MRSLMGLLGRTERPANQQNQPFLSVNPQQQAQRAERQIRATQEAYDGQYNSENKRHGQGTLIRNNGHMYKGQWKHGKIHGVAGHFVNLKRVYHGQWEHSKAHGKGVHKFSNGDIYFGQFKEDEKDGLGRYVFKNGNEYYGQWKKDHMHGEGLFTRNCDTYQGQWESSKKHGTGIYENLITKEIYLQEHRHGEKIKSQRIF